MSGLQHDTLNIALCSMPWAIFNRPSIQLASLQAFISANSCHRVATFHPYLHIASAIGPDLYPEIAHSGWAGEALFSALLFPDNRDEAQQLFYQTLSTRIRKDYDFDELVDAVATACNSWLSEIELHTYDLFGFSICFNQLLASLYMAKLLKTRQPSLPIVFGGSSCSGEVGKALMDQFSEIDYVIDGEGEKRLLHLCNTIGSERQNNVQGILCRHQDADTISPLTPLSLDELPIPDYRSYFTEIRQLFSSSPFIPQLPVEFSRGCWWNRCTFCNLNIQWPTYRCKSGKRMAAEVLSLAKNYESLHFIFTDNALPPKEADFFFDQIARSEKDFNFFAEIRGTKNRDRLQLYRRGGLTTIQAGIEALSTSLLKKMEKGTTAMDNIAMMKLCCENNIKLEGNIIVHFPTSSKAEITKTLENLKYVLPFAPLEPAAFFLGYGSPIYHNPASYSISAITAHKNVRKLFPDQFSQSMTSLIRGYRGDKAVQKKMWRPVYTAIADWQKFHASRTSATTVALSFRDGKDFMIIRQEQPHGTTLHHRLRGLSREIYLATRQPTPVATILEQFPQVSDKALDTFIDEMCRKHLMFRENNQILSLAIQQQ